MIVYKIVRLDVSPLLTPSALTLFLAKDVRLLKFGIYLMKNKTNRYKL
jgi:hypothetical protein